MESVLDRIVELFKLRGAPEEVVRQLERVLDLWRKHELDNEDVYNWIVGASWNYKIPLTPREVAEIRRALLGE
jgi:hypothetical protein